MADFGKHIKNRKTIELNGDTFEIPALGYEYLPELFDIMRKMGAAKEGDKDEISTDKIFEILDKPTIITCRELVFQSFKKGYPEKNDKEIKDFVADNFLELFGEVLTFNMPTGNVDEIARKAAHIKKMKDNESEEQDRKSSEPKKE